MSIRQGSLKWIVSACTGRYSNGSKRRFQRICVYRTYSSEIIKSQFPAITFPEVTCSDFIWKRNQWDQKTAVECGVTGKKYTYGELYSAIHRFGGSLLKMGFQPKDVLGIVSPNNPEYPIAVLGTSSIGGIVTTVNPVHTPREIARQLKNSQTRYVLTVPLLLPVIHQVKALFHGIEKIIVVGEEAKDGTVSFQDMLKSDVSISSASLDVAVKDDTQCLLYTSGTTGLSKGVMLTHYNITSCITMFEQIEMYRNTTKTFQEVFLAVLPFFHIYGFVGIMLYGLACRAKIVTLPNFDPRSYLHCLMKHQPTLLHLVPPIMTFLCNYSEVKHEHCQNVETLIFGAAPAGAALINKLKEKLYPNQPNFIEAYGMTEGAPLTCSKKGMKNPVGSCGVLPVNTEAKILDIGTGTAITNANQKGELCFRGPQVMKGYFHNPEATAETMQDGWLHTGDVGYYDEDGYFFIVDRIKELIKVKGYQVSPSELEDVLREHPGVKDIGVIGIPDKMAGELPCAYIIKSNDSVTEQDIHSFLDGKVAPYKKLAGGIYFVEDIPKSASGKILKKALKEKFLAAL